MAKSYLLPDLDPGTSYEFQVIARGDGSVYTDSDPSSTVSWTTKTKLATPVISTTKTTNSITVSWSKITNATGYVLEYKLSTASTWTIVNVTANVSDSTVSKQLNNLTSGATYDIRVKATSSNANYVESDYSTIATVIVSTQLDSPVVTLTSDTSTIYATWSAISNATSYKVGYKKSDGNSFTYETVQATASPSWSKGSLTSGDTYFVSVQAIGSENYADSPNPNANAIVVKTKLEKPTGLAIARETNRLTLSWTAVANASSYRVYYKKGTGSYQSATASTNSYPLNNLNEGDSYTFYVVAVGTGNYVDSDDSSTISATTKRTLATPTNLAAINVLSTSARLSWTAVANATSYLLTISDANGAISGYNGRSVTSTSIDVTTLTATKQYTVSLIATSTSEDYVDSVPASLVFTTDTKLGTPAAPTIVTKTISSITVTWNTVSAADSYMLAYKLSTAANFTEVPITSANDRPYTLTGLGQGETYTFKVKAITTNEAYENGDYSPTTSATTLVKLDAPDGLNVTDIHLTDSTLNWNSVADAVGYTVRWRKSDATDWQEKNVDA